MTEKLLTGMLSNKTNNLADQNKSMKNYPACKELNCKMDDYALCQTVKPVLRGHSKEDQKIGFQDW